MKTVSNRYHDKKSCSNSNVFHRRMLIVETVVFTIIEGAAYGPETASVGEIEASKLIAVTSGGQIHRRTQESPEICIEVSRLTQLNIGR